MSERYCQNPRCAFRVFDGEATIITPGNQQISILNEVATEIWGCLGDQPRSLEELVSYCAAHYEASEERLRADVLELLEHLVDLGAVERQTEPAA